MHAPALTSRAAYREHGTLRDDVATKAKEADEHGVEIPTPVAVDPQSGHPVSDEAVLPHP